MDHDSFEKYYDQYKHKIYSYLFYRCGRNRELAEDLTADVFVKALEKFHMYNPSFPFHSWLYSITHHHLIDFFRKTRTTVDLAAVENTVEGKADSTEMLDRRIAAEDVEKLLEMVSDEEREILLMRYFQELSMRDISDIVSRPEPTVRVIINRALAKMRNHFFIFFLCLLLNI